MSRGLSRRLDQGKEWLKVSLHLAKCGGHSLCGSENIMACHMILQGHVTKGPSNFMGGSLSRYCPAKFGGHRHCGIGDIMVLVFHVILEDHIIKASFDFIGRSPSR